MRLFLYFIQAAGFLLGAWMLILAGIVFLGPGPVIGAMVIALGLLVWAGHRAPLDPGTTPGRGQAAPMKTAHPIARRRVLRESTALMLCMVLNAAASARPDDWSRVDVSYRRRWYGWLVVVYEHHGDFPVGVAVESAAAGEIVTVRCS